MKVTTISNFRKSMAQFIDDTILNCEPLLVTTSNNSVVIMGKNDFDNILERINHKMKDDNYGF